MVMRLLPKSDILKAKATAKKQEIDEGVKLAQRIDGLRQVAATEEKNLQDFRTREVAKVHAEIAKERAVLDPLKKEVADLRKEKARGMQDVEKERTAISKANDRLQEREETCEKREKDAANILREAKAAEKRAQGIVAKATTKEDLATDKLAEAERLNKGAKEAHQVAEKAKTSALELKEKVHKELTHRDMMAASRERGITIKEERLAEERKQLDAEWVVFNDRREAFYRELKRNKK